MIGEAFDVTHVMADIIMADINHRHDELFTLALENLQNLTLSTAVEGGQRLYMTSTLGWDNSARPMATRCRSPAESCAGAWTSSGG